MTARILCVSRGMAGPVSACVELSRRLAVAGHGVTFAGADGDRKLAENHALEFMALEPNRYETFLEGDIARGLFERVGRLGERRRVAMRSVSVEGFAAGVRKLAPDLVLVDGEMHEHVIAAAALGVPVAILNTFCSIWRRPGLPPPHLLVRPGVGWRGTDLGISLQWSLFLLRKRVKLWRQRLGRAGCDRLSVLRGLAEGAGFDLRREADFDHWLIPYTYGSRPVLSLHALEFDFPHRPQPRVHYVGPMILERRGGPELGAEDESHLAAILDRKARGGASRRLIFAGFGSVGTVHDELLERVLAAVASRTDWDLVISTSGRAPPSLDRQLPANVHVFPWVPQLRLLRAADAAVTHGGINTIDECVVCGVPMLIYCGFETDMAGNTARVVHHRLGIAGDGDQDDGVAIARHLDRLMCEPHFAQNLRQFQRRYAAYTERCDAERVVEHLLAIREAVPARSQGRSES